MDTAAYLDDLRSLIKKDRLEEVLAQLKVVLEESPLLDEALQQSGRLSAIRRQVRLGTVGHEEATLTRNQIRKGLLDLLQEMQDRATEQPALEQEVREAVSIVNSKNVVTGSIQAGGNVTIGDTTITESAISRLLRYLSYILVPILVAGAAYFGYQYFQGRRPLAQPVKVHNRTPNPELPFEQGQLRLTAGDFEDAKTIRKGETVTFSGIPSRNRSQPATLSFRSSGFEPVDTTFLLQGDVLDLGIRRDQSLARVFGTVQDEEGQPLPGVQVRVQDELQTTTDAAGSFSIDIPFGRQRKSQRVRALAEGYQPWDFLTPVVPGEPVAIVLSKK